MAHFAELDESNTVIRTVVIDNNDLYDMTGIEQESLGIEACQRIFGADTRWVQTSYNASIRHRFAGIGMTYDETNDVFLPMKIFPSWVLETEDFTWVPPLPYPSDGKVYHWDEESISWVETVD